MSKVLETKVKELVAAATHDVDPKAIKGTVEAVLLAFDAAKKPARDAAVTSLGKALAKAEGLGAQVLCLALGALVESGAAPDLAFPALAKDLPALLEGADAFAHAVLKKAKTDDLAAAIEAAGPALAKKLPAEAEAWRAFAPRCLAALACLVRSPEARAKAAKSKTLLPAAEHLAERVPEVAAFVQAAKILDDAELVVLAPSLGRGFVARISEIASNAELYVLVAQAFVGKGKWAGKAPPAKVVAAVAKSALPKVDLAYTPPFHLTADGHALELDGDPADLPRVGKARVVFVHEPELEEPIDILPPFEALRPKLVVTRELGAAEVAKLAARV